MTRESLFVESLANNIKVGSYLNFFFFIRVIKLLLLLRLDKELRQKC